MELTIENNFLRVSIDTKGAELVRVVNLQTQAQMLWDANPQIWNRHAPILFPYCGRLKNGTFKHKDTVYEGAQHGFARDMEYTKKISTQDSVTLCLEANALTMEKFPFAFKMEVSYTLHDKSISHHVEITNDSDEVMPFGFGFHPGFLCPFDEGKSIENYVIQFDTPQTPVVIETGTEDGLVTGKTRTFFENETEIPITNELFANDSICFSNLTCKTMSLVEKETNRRIVVDVEQFPYVLIWSAKAPVEFVCIEPWYSLPDARDARGIWDEKPAAAALQPGEKWNTTLQMTWER